MDPLTYPPHITSSPLSAELTDPEDLDFSGTSGISSDSGSGDSANDEAEVEEEEVEEAKEKEKAPVSLMFIY